MKAIVSATENNAIGRGGELLVRCREDLRRFRALTSGGVIVMGRRTFESLPGALPDRVNLVLTRDAGFAGEGVTTVASLCALRAELARYPGREAWVIGGETVYAALLPECSEAHVTRWLVELEGDAFFPELRGDPAWRLAEASGVHMCGDIPYRYETYVRAEATPHKAIGARSSS
ncbi:MAG: dihydrofolate reductase [Clostridia bacterium]|nr:dihydrofolate reductase [Clostridia bacterium]